MARLFIITFAVLGWAWFELSGGTDFQPGENGVTVLASYDAPEPTERVARADSGGTLTSVSDAGGRRLAFSPALSPRTGTTLVAAGPEKLAVLTAAPVLSDAVANQPLQPVNSLTQIALTSEPEGGEPIADAPVDYRFVTGRRVNMRNGPGTSFPVVGSLVRDEEVEVLEDPGLGWVKLRALQGDRVGWMSANFLKPAG